MHIAPTMYAQRPVFFEPRPAPSFHVPLLVPAVPIPDPQICDNCYSCQLWKQLMETYDALKLRTELPIGLVE